MTIQRIRNWVPLMGDSVESLADWVRRHYQDHMDESVARIEELSNIYAANLDITGQVTHAYTMSATTAGEDVHKITVTDATAASSGMHRGFVVDTTLTGTKTGSAYNAGINVDLTMSGADSGAVPQAYGVTSYMTQTGNPTIGVATGLETYMEDLGTNVSSLIGVDIGINSSNLASSRHTGIRIRNHSGTATTGILFESAFATGLDLSGATCSTADITLQNGETISNATDGIVAIDGDITVKGPWIDVRAYGAKGDGVTDDTTAIQATIDAAEAKSGITTITFAGADFLITGALKITVGGVVLDLRGATITTSGNFADGDADDSAAINIRGASSQCQNVWIYGGIINGPASTGEAWGIHVSWAKNVWISGTKVDGSADAGIRIDGYGSSWGNNDHINTLDEGYTSYISVQNTYCSGATAGAGIELIADPTHCFISHNWCDGNVVNGLRVALAAFSHIGHNIIQDTGLNSKSLYLAGRSLTVDANFISGKNSTGSGLLTGIYLAESLIDSKVINNTVLDVTGSAIDGDTEDDGTHIVQRCTIAGNKCIDWGTTTEWGIIIRGANSDNNLIESNKLYSSTGTTRGINVQEGTGRAPIRNIIRDNIIDVPSTQLTISGRGNRSYRNIDFTTQRTIDGDNYGPDDYVDSATPTAGTFEVRDKVWIDPPSAGNIFGYVCTTAGTQGTLAGITGSITINTAALTVNDASDIEVRDRITIVGVTGIKVVLSISGDVVTLTSNADATVSGAAVAYSTAVFKSMGSLAA